jgi:hypothetical protein
MRALLAAVPAWVWAAAAVWAVAAAVSEWLHARRVGAPFLGLGRGYTFPAPDIGLSRLAAQARRVRLTEFLQRFDNTGGVPLEFLEVPPGGEGGGRERYSDDETQYWRAARLRMQLRSDHLLLLERVTDALVHFQREGRLSAEDFPVSIRLERIPVRLREILPWRVVLTTANPRGVLAQLADPALQGWFGIALRVHRPRGQRPGGTPEQGPTAEGSAAGGPSRPPRTLTAAHGRCVAGSDGLEGTVGGTIGEPGGEFYGVTCAHVLSSACIDRRWPLHPPDREFTQERPDVALIRLHQPCFVAKNGAPALDAAQADIELAVARGSKVGKLPPLDKVHGLVITAAASGFKLGPFFYRGPHFHVTPYFVRQFGIVWPRDKRFSKEGNSGCWIFDEETQQWLGMVIGGFEPPNTLSVGISSEFIRDAFARSRISGGRGNGREASAFFAGG